MSRCLPSLALMIVVVSTLAALPIVAAQPAAAKPVVLTVDHPAATAEPGSSASFTATVSNPNTLPPNATVTLAGVSRPSADWTYNFTPISLDVPAGSNKSSALTVNAPSNAQRNTTYTLTFAATDSLNQQSNVVSVDITIPAAAPPAPKPSPRIDVAVPSVSAQIGVLDGASSSVNLVSHEPAPITVTLGIEGPASWGAHFERTVQVLQPELPAQLPLRATVPDTTRTGAVQSFTVRVTAADGSSIDRVWTVTATAPPAAPPTSGTSPTPSTPSAASPSSATPSTPASAITPTFGLTAVPLVATLDAPVGGTVKGAVRLTNTGTQPLHLTAKAQAGDGWPVRLGAEAFDLPAGVTKDIPFEVDVPADVPSGGSAQARVYFTADDNGLIRTATFTLDTLPGAPRDDSKSTTTVVVAAPAAGGFGVSPSTGIAVVGLAAVGSGALVLARRPLREKLAWAAVGMYTRLARPDVLGHPERERLYKIIETTPGVHFHALQRQLEWNTGTLTYHLRVLERHGFAVSRRDGPYRRFYIQGAAPRKESFNNDAPQGLRADVLEAVRNQNGISQGDLALALGANKQTVNYHVKALERQGVLRVEKRGRETFLYLAVPGAIGTPAAQA